MPGPVLPEALKAGIVAMVKTCGSSRKQEGKG